jgi:hypothetical protein
MVVNLVVVAAVPMEESGAIPLTSAVPRVLPAVLVAVSSSSWRRPFRELQAHESSLTASLVAMVVMDKQQARAVPLEAVVLETAVQEPMAAESSSCHPHGVRVCR